MFDPDAIRIADYNYPLPGELIAQFPLAERDASRLLVCRDGNISEDQFSNIGRHLPPGSLLVFNDTRVIRARILFRKQTGAGIEIFCLVPADPGGDLSSAFRQTGSATWKCLVGNLKKWKGEILVHESNGPGDSCTLFARYLGPCSDGSHDVEFTWSPPGLSFSGVLQRSGLIPLPPYIHRPAEKSDEERYQTIFAAPEGSVAAPTAGLHFTGRVLEDLASKGILTGKVTLHVGVGTFKPVTADRISGHVMHHEKIVVSRNTIAWLLESKGRPVFAVGTTSARTLESLYWTGLYLLTHGQPAHPAVSQWDPYKNEGEPTTDPAAALGALLSYLDAKGLQEFNGETQLMIVPGYTYRLLSGIITNFHMPQSTLLLLVAAMIGPDWERAYEFARLKGFRFLSYGDSCLFFNPGK